MNGAGRRRGDFYDSSHLRTHAQFRTCAEIEFSRAWVPYMAGCQFSRGTVLRISALHSKQSRYLLTYAAVALDRVTVLPADEES